MKTLNYEEYDAFESSIDTKYFGVSSAKVVLKKPCISADMQTRLLDFMREFEFVMISNRSNNASNNHWIGEKTNAFLVDVNVQLRKNLSTSQISSDCSNPGHLSTISEQLPENNQIVHIAETSFKISQFQNDPYLPVDKAKHIYGDIVKNAFGNQGRFFVVASQDEIITGFLLFVIDKTASSSTIQLAAVNEEFKGQGIARALICSMESYVSCQEIKTINVGTQFNNIGAIKTYYSSGFDYSGCSSIYHYWPWK